MREKQYNDWHKVPQNHIYKMALEQLWLTSSWYLLVSNNVYITGRYGSVYFYVQ